MKTSETEWTWVGTLPGTYTVEEYTVRLWCTIHRQLIRRCQDKDHKGQHAADYIEYEYR